LSDDTPTLSGLLSNYACPILQIQDFLVAVSRIWYYVVLIFSRNWWKIYP